MRYSFSELVTFARTGLNPRKNFVLKTSGNPYITIKNIKNGQLLIDKNTHYVDDEALKLIHKRSKIKKGDILFASIGRIGDMYIIEEEPLGWDINESVFAFTLDTKIIRQKYFYYLFKSKGVRDYLLTNSSGSTFASIKMNQLQRMTFDIPSLPEQDKIIKLLSTLDQIKSQEEDRLAKYDELIKSRFIEMFNTCKYDEYTLGELSDVSSGDPLTSPSIVDIKSKENCYLVYGANGVRGYYSKPNRHNKCILVGRVGAQAGNVHFYDGDFFATEHALVVEVNKNFVEPEWLSYVLAERNLFSIAKGAAQPVISSSNLKKEIIKVPNFDLQKQYVNFCHQIYKSKFNLQNQIKNTQELIDSKMAEYFSGEED